MLSLVVWQKYGDAFEGIHLEEQLELHSTFPVPKLEPACSCEGSANVYQSTTYHVPKTAFFDI
jgi:hypothetical protein